MNNHAGSESWPTLGAVAPGALVEARLAAHYAAQPMAAAAYALLPMRDDHSHTNLLWSGAHGYFLGRALPGGSRCFLDVARLRTGVLAPGLEEVAVVELGGQTLERGFAELAEALRGVGEQLPGGDLRLPAYDLPEAPVASGEAFPSPGGPQLGELALWFRNGARALGEVAAEQLGGAEVRCWPHHFDLAALLALEGGGASESPRTVGVGLSPGDGYYAEPYFYVSPWPYPRTADLPALGGGARWHTKGFTAAVLPGSDLVGGEGGEAQHARVLEALRSSISACRALLGTPAS